MKKLLLLIVVMMISHTTVFPQGCLPEGINFTRQTQVDSFLVNYPDCTIIEGNVTIVGMNDITNLNALSNITAIGGGLAINDCYTLLNFTGLNNLQTISGDVLIKNNINQNSFTGLENLTTIGGNFDTYMYYNSTITNFQGLNGLTTIGGYFFISIYSVLENFSGLENLEAIGDFFRVYGTTIQNFTGLDNLNSIGGYFTVSGNPALASFTGLEQLSSVASHFSVESSPRLTSFAGLSNLTYVGGDINIYGNDSLTSLSGIDNIAAATIDKLYFYGNHMLSTCEVKSVCDYLAAPAGSIYIDNNAPGCNSQAEVEDACSTIGMEEIPHNSGFSIYPNPSTSKITIETSATQIPALLTILNTGGQQLIQRKVTDPKTVIDISGLSGGVYLVKLQNDKTVIVGKLIKE